MSGLKAWIPSRNTALFLASVSTVAGLKFYDRMECEKVRQFYQKQAKVLADKPMSIDQNTEKYYIFLNGPENSGDSLFRSRTWFEKYVKPIFDAGSIDYEFVEEKKQGDIQKYLLKQLKDRRRGDVEANDRFHGIVALGHEAYLKVLAGIQDGVLVRDISKPAPAPISVVEEVKIESKVYESPSEDAEKPEEAKTEESKEETKTEEVEQPPPPPYNSITKLNDDELLSTPQVPQLPPVGYIRQHNYIGWKMVPLRVFNWFREREKVKEAGFDALSIVLNQSVPFDHAKHTESFTALDSRNPTSQLHIQEGLNVYNEQIVNKLRVFETDSANYYHVEPKSE